jgi:hypothetical protein
LSFNSHSLREKILKQSKNFTILFNNYLKIKTPKMRKIYLLFMAICCYTTGSFAQITIAGSTGTANGIYTSFTNVLGAFAALNTAGSHNPADVITISVTADVLTEAGTNALNAGTWASITVTPVGARTISGTTLAAAPLQIIDFNGADNVTINGINSGGNSLTIANLSILNTSGTSTIRFIGGATNNTITNCFIQGSGTQSVATNGANIFFSTDAVTAAGNDNNTISNNDIGPAGANLPTKAILGNGSTTTTAIGNSGIVINNNNIHDYFGAAVTSAGIATNGGCNTWSITNNRFYQTGTRTWTTGALHNAINIANTTATSGAQGFTITGNIVGYASNTQTGTYTLTGSTGSFRGIVFNGITAGTVSNINSNTVAAVSVTGVTSSGTSSSAPFMGIYITNGLANTNSNTFGSQVATGSLVYATTSASAADMQAIFNFSVDAWTANTNNIGGLTASNAGAGAANAYGLRLNTSSGVTTTLNGNTIGGSVANSIQSTSTATGAQVAGIFVSTSIATVSNNTIRNLTAAGGTGTTTAASVIGIDFISATPINTASQNTIFNLSNTNAAAATTVTGIQFTGAAAGNVVQRNLIYDLSSATTSITAEVNGIRVAGGTTIYRNNMIRLGAGIANALGSAATNSGTSGLNGINEALGTNSFFHNSVYLEGAPTAGVGASFAFNGVQTVNTRSFRDNIFFNARSNSGATGKHYAIKINGTVVNPTGLTINNNVYFANGTGAIFGFYNSLDVTNLAGWKAAVGQDAGSFESNPQYNAPGAATPDLHLHPTNPTVAEGNGVDVGVTDDYDGQTRASFTPVDIGADCGNFVGIDLAAPSITSITLLGTNCDVVTRTVTVLLTDVTGVDNAGLQPRIYFRKNAGAYFSAAGSLTSGTVNSGTWTFTITYATVGGVVAADVISYFIVAQDVSAPPNVGGSPSGGLVLTDVNTVTTPPTVPLSYTIQSTLAAGTYLVGTGQVSPNFATLTAAVAAYNNSCLGGAIVFELQDATYTTAPAGAGEVYPITINANPDASSTKTLTIKPKAGVSITMTGSTASSMFVLNDADFVTIDGSSTGASAAACSIGGNAAIRELTFQNTNVGTSAVVLSIQSGVNGAKNNTIKNVNVLGQDPTTTLIGISLGGNTPGTSGTDNDNNRVENCSVKRSIFGIYSAGISLANQNLGTVITKNDLSALTTDRIRRVGIVVFNENGVQITENSVAVETNESADAIGIGLGNQSIDATTTTSGGVTNALVSHNKINGIASLSAVGFSAAGISVAGAVGGANTISNNMITGVSAPATAPDLVAGIFVVGVTGADTRLYFNSVSMTGDRGTVSAQMPAYGIAITGTDPTVDLRNNILYTTQIASGGGVDAKSYAIGMVSTTFVNLNSNYNIFWSAGANAGGYRTGSLGAAAGTSYAVLAAWAAAVADDANSQEVSPPFVSDLNNLHLLPSGSCVTTAKGISITGITTDFDCNSRNTVPFIGAHEAYEPATATTVISNNNDERTYTISGATDLLFDCRLIANIAPGSVAGRMRAKTNITAAGTNGLEPYGPRQTVLEPTTDGTATVKLYFKQTDFDAYNTYVTTGSLPYQPVPLDVADVAGNAANVIIRQYHGVNATFAVNTGTELLTPTSVVYDAAGDNGTGWWVVTVNAGAFSLFNQTSKVIITPVTITNVRGEITGATNTVYWTTVTEQNNRKFVVEKSLTGSNFTPIGEVASRAVNGNSNTSLNYNFVDANPVNGKQYYRLQMVDNAGNKTYSAIVTLRRGAGKLEIVDVHPNPTTGTVYFNILGNNSNVTIAVRDLSGKEVLRKGLVTSNNFSIDFSKLANGIYMLEAIDVQNGEKAVFKVMKN